MNHLFILGAGASKQAGAPLMNDFFDKAQDLLRLKTLGVLEAKSDFALVFDAIADLQGIHAKSYLDLDNLEVVFGAIEMGKLLKKLGDRSPEYIQKLYDAMVTLIYKTLENTIEFPVHNEVISPPKPYDLFASYLLEAASHQPKQDPHRFSFITFNYDLCLDVMLDSMLNFDYCLEGRCTDRSPLLKLHGSINWGAAKDGKIVPFQIGDKDFIFYDRSRSVIFALGSLLNQKEHQGDYLKGPPIIVPPTWNKYSYHEQLTNVWQVAAAELGKADNIFVIGYSMPETDSFFKYLYALGSESNTRIRNFIVINPDRDAEKRFRALIGRGTENRFRFIPASFEQGLMHVRDILMKP